MALCNMTPRRKASERVGNPTATDAPVSETSEDPFRDPTYPTRRSRNRGRVRKDTVPTLHPNVGKDLDS